MVNGPTIFRRTTIPVPGVPPPPLPRSQQRPAPQQIRTIAQRTAVVPSTMAEEFEIKRVERNIKMQMAAALEREQAETPTFVNTVGIAGLEPFDLKSDVGGEKFVQSEEAKRIIEQFGRDVGADIRTASFLESLSKKRQLTSDEQLSLASARQSATEKLSLQQRQRAFAAPGARGAKIARQAAQAERRAQIAELNLRGFTVGERGRVVRREPALAVPAAPTPVEDAPGLAGMRPRQESLITKAVLAQARGQPSPVTKEPDFFGAPKEFAQKGLTASEQLARESLPLGFAGGLAVGVLEGIIGTGELISDPLKTGRGVLGLGREVIADPIKTGGKVFQEQRLAFERNPAVFAGSFGIQTAIFSAGGKAFTPVSRAVKTKISRVRQVIDPRVIKDFPVKLQVETGLTSLQRLKMFENRITNITHSSRQLPFRTSTTEAIIKKITGKKQELLLEARPSGAGAFRTQVEQFQFFTAAPTKPGAPPRAFLRFAGLKEPGVVVPRKPLKLALLQPPVRVVLLRERIVPTRVRPGETFVEVLARQEKRLGRPSIAAENLFRRTREAQFTIPVRVKKFPKTGRPPVAGTILTREADIGKVFFRQKIPPPAFLPKGVKEFLADTDFLTETTTINLIKGSLRPAQDIIRGEKIPTGLKKVDVGRLIREEAVSREFITPVSVSKPLARGLAARRKVFDAESILREPISIPSRRRVPISDKLRSVVSDVVSRPKERPIPSIVSIPRRERVRLDEIISRAGVSVERRGEPPPRPIRRIIGDVPPPVLISDVPPPRPGRRPGPDPGPPPVPGRIPGRVPERPPPPGRVPGRVPKPDDFSKRLGDITKAPAFGIIVKKKGKEILLSGKFTKTEALKRGAQIVDLTLRASFRIVPVAGQPQKTNFPSTLIPFRRGKRDPRFFVEPRRFRLNNLLEVGEIQRARRAAGKGLDFFKRVGRPEKRTRFGIKNILLESRRKRGGKTLF